MKLSTALLSVCLAVVTPNAWDPQDAPLVSVGLPQGIVLQLEEGRANGDDHRTLQALVTDALNHSWQLTDYGMGMYRLMPRAGSGTPVITSTAAWEVVHRLRHLGAVAWAEPIVSSLVPLGGQTAAALRECRGGGGGSASKQADEILPLAAKDSQWSLGAEHGADVIAAWKRFAKTEPGAGVHVGHPDTGFLEHDMILPALLSRGFNFVLGQADALDQSGPGRLQWPGHGTKTASVIAGRRSYSVGPNATRTVSGVAPGARVMPLRVASRVVMFDRLDLDMTNLALAIRGAAIGDPNLVAARADVISISLGGAPSRAVLEALRVARRHGTIVLAAAGNQVPRREVVWPARYDEVIAVAATNAASLPWAGTSRGPKIGISAPGEDVWAGSAISDGAYRTCVEPATGTSYAVATTAGVAALWLSSRAGTSGDRQDRPEQFRKALGASARQTASLPKQEFGAGIVDADALLGTTVGPATTRVPHDTCDDLRGLASLLDAPGESAVANAVLAGPAVAAGLGCQRVRSMADELAFVLSTSPDALTDLVTARSLTSVTARAAAIRSLALRLPTSATLRARLLEASGSDTVPVSARHRLP